MKLHTVAVLGVSVRPLAQAGARAGWRVVAADNFGDADTRAASQAWWPLAQGLATPSVAALRQVLQQAQARHGAQAWLAGSGLDGHVAHLRAGAQVLPLLGMAPELHGRLRAPASFYAGLAACGVPHPATCWQVPPPDAAGWLRKSARGSGGWHIRAATAQDRPAPQRYWQQQVTGQPMSLLFLADGRQAMPVGLNRLRVAPLAGRPWVYQGAIGPVPNMPLLKQLQAWLARLVPHFGLAGLASLDFMLAGDARALALEINPRPSATLTLHDAAWPQGLLAAHVQALQGTLPTAPAPLPGCRGEAICFAPAALRVDDALAARLAALGAADLPRAGQAIASGQPLCSVRAQAAHADAVEQGLRQALQRVTQLVRANATP